MCGIVGFADLGVRADDMPARLEAMLAAIEHRGPDEMGCWWDGRVGLGNARLSIIDLAAGQQPMVSQDGRHVLVFNGEIFNYRELRTELERLGRRFGTNSDTEVLLEALIVWGRDALPRLNGQFAFAFFDRRGSLLLARDRFGERPLFYWHAGRRFAFASEIKALFRLPEIPRRLDVAGLRQVAHFWTTDPASTVFQEVVALPPGHWAELSTDGTVSVGRYHGLPPRNGNIRNQAEAVELVRHALTRAVELRLRSDVEVALYLSGGIDSTILCALAQRSAGGNLRSFSVTFEDAGFDESAYQMGAAAHLGTRHEAVRVSRADIRAAFPAVVGQAETALFRTAPTPLYLLAKAVHERGIKVVLTGEGADELFLGYDIFKEAVFLARFGGMASDEERLATLSRLYPYLEHFSGPQARALLLFYRSFAGNPGDPLLSHRPRFSTGLPATRLFGHDYDAAAGETRLLAAIERFSPGFAGRPLLDRAQILEQLTLLDGYLLSSQGDRMTAAHSVEGRCPFLDPDVMDAAAQLPEEMLLKGGLDEKFILKQAFGHLLPDAIVTRPKQPYRSPGADCFRLDGGDDWLPALLSPERMARSAVIEPAQGLQLVQQVNRLPMGQVSPRLDHAYMVLLSVLLLEEQLLGVQEHARATIPVRRLDGRAGG